MRNKSSSKFTEGNKKFPQIELDKRVIGRGERKWSDRSVVRSDDRLLFIYSAEGPTERAYLIDESVER